MVIDCTDDFEVAWQDPADASLRWGRDRLHLPRPLPPLAQAYGVRLALPVAPGARVSFLNGYAFVARPAQPRPPEPAGPPPLQTPAGSGRAEDWQTAVVPRIEEICHGIRDGDYESASRAQLAESLDGIFLDAVRAFEYTMEAGRTNIGRIVEFFSFCEREFPPDGLALAGTLIQGFENQSAGSARALGELTELAAANPALAAALKSGRFGDLEAAEGAEEFFIRLDAFLDMYGWRAESWALMHVPVWAEDPAPALEFVARYLGQDSSPLAAMHRVSKERDEATAGARAKLSRDKLPEFDELVAVARQITQLTEGRAFWQLTVAGVLRVPLLALGRKLVDAGVLDAANDIFYLYLDEVKGLAANPRPMGDVVAHRKADLTRWERLDAPAFVGASSPPPAPPDPILRAAFRLVLGVGVESSFEGGVLKGSAAGKGVIVGRARVIGSLAEAHRLSPGEVLVCQTTSPAWTPLIAIAGGVVTDSGGILSHTAICAREFGIPCVVGTQVATASIPDGAIVRVDGGNGTITIEAIKGSS